MNNVEDLAKNTEVVAIAGQLLLVAAVFKFQTDTGSFLRSVKGTARRKNSHVHYFVAYWCRGSNINYLGLLY
jgi:MATE family multidrug resistance protein